VAATLVYRQPPAAPQIAEHSPAADGRPPQPGRRPEPAEPAFDDSAKPAREEQLLWLREGDRLPCRVVAIDEQGVAFATSVASATFLPHARIRAWERQSGLPLPTLDAGRMKRLLTLPRAQQAHPPTHVIESTGGDLLRTRLQRMDSEQAVVEVRLQEQQLARAEISRIIWLHPGEPALGPPSNQEADGTSTPARDAAANVPPEQPSSAAEPAWTAQVQAVRDDGVRLTFHPTGFADGVLAGQREGLGDCRVDLADVERLLLGAALEAAADNHPYAAWQLAAAPQPRFVAESTAGPDSAAESDSPLAGRPAPDFALTTLAGAHYRLAERRGQVVVLDFWASWCGPCIEALPQAEAVAAEFSAERVRLTAVNVQEDAATAEAALARLAARPETVLDRDGAVAAQYAVSAIPQTVVIDAAGRVREVLVGGGPQYADRLRIAIRAALDEAPRAQPTTSP
jgi:thiol-disulfide isomerase/thioredoxin